MLLAKHRIKYEDDQESHFFQCKDEKILHKETNGFKRAFSEMVYIKWKIAIFLIKLQILNN